MPSILSERAQLLAHSLSLIDARSVKSIPYAQSRNFSPAVFDSSFTSLRQDCSLLDKISKDPERSHRFSH